MNPDADETIDPEETSAEGENQENESGKGESNPHQNILDLTFRQILNLPHHLLIMIVNGLFGTNVPLYSKVSLECDIEL